MEGSSDNQDRQPDKPQSAGDENETNGAGQDQNQDTPDHGNAESETGNQYMSFESGKTQPNDQAASNQVNNQAENNPQSPENDGEVFERIRDYLGKRKEQ